MLESQSLHELNTLGQIDIDSMPRGAAFSFELVSPNVPTVYEQASVYIISPCRRLLYDRGQEFRPPIVELRMPDGSNRILMIYSQGRTGADGSSIQYPTLIAGELTPGCPKRKSDFAMSNHDSVIIPYRNAHQPVVENNNVTSHEGVPNNTVIEIQEFLEAAYKKPDSTTIQCADGSHRIYISGDELIVASDQNAKIYKVKKVVDLNGRNIHYLIERATRVENKSGDPLVIYTTSVISNNPEYQGTRYIRYVDLLNETDDSNQGHDVILELPPQGDPYLIARQTADQKVADSVIVDLPNNNIRYGSQIVEIPQGTPEDILIFIKLTQSPPIPPERRATRLSSGLGKLLQRINL